MHEDLLEYKLVRPQEDSKAMEVEQSTPPTRVSQFYHVKLTPAILCLLI